MISPAKKRLAFERLETEQRILAIARRLFLEQGYLGCTIRDIALEAQLTPGAIYVYFKGKDELFGRVCEQCLHLYLGLVQEETSNAPTALGKLKALLQAHVKFYRDYPNEWRVMDHGLEGLILSPELRQRLQELIMRGFLWAVDMIEGGINEGCFIEGIDSHSMAYCLWAAIDGIFYHDRRRYLREPGLEFEQLIEMQTENILSRMLRSNSDE